MSNPTVVCIMLANGREAMVRRAVESFRAQTYQEKRLLVLDSGEVPVLPNQEFAKHEPGGEMVMTRPQCAGWTIGALRNLANEAGSRGMGVDIIAHMDSDDWSHPNRIAEQVALLQSSGADVVGLREMLFWDQTRYRRDKVDVTAHAGTPSQFIEEPVLGQAWLYSHPMPTYALGTSLLYWRRTWEAHPFIDGNQEDWHFIHAPGVRTLGATSFGGPVCDALRAVGAATPDLTKYEPRMIASIHGGNTCSKIQPECDEWTRAADFDAYCRRTMEGA